MSTIDMRIMHQGNSVAPKSTQLALSVDTIIHNAAELMSESTERLTGAQQHRLDVHTTACAG